MATTNLDSADLKAVLAGGLIREDVMDQIFDISDITLEFTTRAGKATHDNSYSEWTSDKRQAPNLANKVVDGADITQNDTQVGKRIGNHGQISVKAVQVSSRADASDVIGRARESAYQIMMRGDELRRDVEAISLSGQGSIADDGATVAGQTASVFAQSSVNKNLGAAGTIGGFNTGTKLFPAVGLGTKRGVTETMLKNMFQQVWQGGGEGANVLMSTPGVIRQIADFFFTSGAHIATLVAPARTGPLPRALSTCGKRSSAPWSSWSRTDCSLTLRRLSGISCLAISTISNYRSNAVMKPNYWPRPVCRKSG